MLAVIHRSSSDSEIPLIPIAGKALLIRQLQWLRSCGFDQVAVEVPDGADGRQMVALLEKDPLGWDVVPVVSDEPLAPQEVARRAGFPGDVLLLALPADTLGGGDLSKLYVLASSFIPRDNQQPRGDLVVELSPQVASHRELQEGELRLIGGCAAPSRVVLGPGWGVRISCAADAIAMGAAALLGQGLADALLVHAAELEPGVWVARGGRVEPGAEVTAPVLIGAGAIVRAGARIGPRVFLGDRAVVERDAVLSDAIVAPDTIVGEQLTAHEAVLTPLGLQSAEAGGAFLQIDDSLILARRRGGAGSRQVRPILAAVAAVTCALALGLGGLLG